MQRCWCVYADIPPGVAVFKEDDITCSNEADPVWGIVWAQTAAGDTDTQRCPGGIIDTKGETPSDLDERQS